jgi:hypothetical protein
MTERARRAFRDSFYAATDPDLPGPERRRQAEAAYRLPMTRLSQRGVAARGGRRGDDDLALGT